MRKYLMAMRQLNPRGQSIVIVAAIVLAAGLLLAASGCTDATTAGEARRSTNGQSADEAPAVEVIPVQLQDLSRTIEMPGTVEGYETADLYAKIGGYLQEMNVDIGDPVEKGQVLAVLSVPEMQQDLLQKQALIRQAQSLVNQARAVISQTEAEITSAGAMLKEAQTERAEKDAQLRFRQAEHMRYQELVESRAARRDLLDEARYQLEAAQAACETVEARIRTAAANLDAATARRDKAAADYDSAQAGVAVAESNLEHVQTMFQYRDIRAPFDGHVTQRHLDPGAFVQPAEGNSGAKPLLTVTRTDVVRIFLDIPMAEVRFLDRGDPAVLDRINVLPGERFEDGVVTRFSPSLNKSSRMMRVEVDLDNPDGKLLPGYYGYVRLNLAELPGTPIVPSSAVMTTDGGESYVYMIEDGACRKCVITPNFQDGTIFGVATGLKGGEQIIAAGGSQLDEGQRVTAAARDDAARG